MARLDRLVIERLRSTVGPELFSELARDFVADTQRLADALRDAARQRDLGILRRRAHELRGVAALFGATDLAACCSEIEAEASEADEIEDRVSVVVEICAESREALTSMLKPKDITGAA